VIDAEQFGLRMRAREQRADELLEINPTHEPNRRLLAHLRTDLPQYPPWRSRI
jgi:hypothetical protein